MVREPKSYMGYGNTEPRFAVLLLSFNISIEMVAYYNRVRDCIGNPYVKGNISRKAKGIIKNDKEEYLVFYTYYPIDRE